MLPITIYVHIGLILSAPYEYHARAPTGSDSKTHHEEHKRSVHELKKEKAKNEEKEKHLQKNLDNLFDQLASMVQNVLDL